MGGTSLSGDPVSSPLVSVDIGIAVVVQGDGAFSDWIPVTNREFGAWLNGSAGFNKIMLKRRWLFILHQIGHFCIGHR